jgi:RNA polymerase sigma factor (sigma-70 family)
MPTHLTASRRARAEALALEIFAEHRTHLMRIAERNSLNRDDAEESLQEAIIAFIRAYDPERGAHPLAWLTLVLKRQCWERTRRERLGLRAGQEVGSTEDGPGPLLELIPDPARGPAAQAELREEVAQARESIARLKLQERRALSLLAFGYSYQEIMEITGWTYTKINRCVAEGRARLRRLSSEASEAERTPPRSHSSGTSEISSVR